MKRWWIPVIVVLVVVGGFFVLRSLRQNQGEAAAANLQTEPVQAGPLTATVGATGIVRSNQSALLSFKTNGTVEAVQAKLGQVVQAGDVLATLKQTSLSAQIVLAEVDLVSAQRALDDLTHSEQARAAAMLALAQAEDALEDAQYTIRVRQQGNRASQSTIDTARASLVLAEDKLDQAKRAYDQVSGRPGDDPVRALALTNLSSAQAQYDSALRNLNWYLGSPTANEQSLLEAQVAVAEARLADAQREWERVKDGPSADDIRAAEARVAAAQATLEMAQVTAPFTGTITAVEVKPGDQVTAGTLAFRLDDLSQHLVDVDLSEVDINRIKVGQPATLNFDAIPSVDYTGEVIEIGEVGTSVQGVVNFPVTLVLANTNGEIKPGMTAAVNIVVDQLENVLQVPNRAVRVINAQRVVYLLQAGQATPVAITLGVSSDVYSEVLEGEIKAGDLVVLNPPTYVFDPNEEPPFVRGMRQ
jgi:HlyD family secretion protein